MFLKIKDLPQMIQDSLSSIGYGKADIKVSIQDSFSFSSGGMQGLRQGYTLLNMTTGEKKSMVGSWGGANTFDTVNMVDNDNREHAIPDSGLVIDYTSGYGPVMAELLVSKMNVFPALAAPVDTLSQDEKQVLTVLESYKAFARKEYLTGYRASYEKNFRVMSQIDLDNTYIILQKKGFIKINKIGSVSITTEGKNASNR